MTILRWIWTILIFSVIVMMAIFLGVFFILLLVLAPFLILLA